jgi:beta-fructofuranosidase
VPTGAHDAGVAVARRAPDGTFTPGDVFVAGPPTDPTVVDVRDPFLVTIGGRRYAIQGGGRADRSAPLVPLWAVDRLDDWRPLGFLVADDDPATLALAPAQLWECPQLVRLPAARSDGSAGDDGGEDDGGSAPSSSPGTWVLLVSRWADGRGLDEYAVVGDVVARGDGLRFVGRAGGPLDEGPLLYAAQAVPDGERVLVWAWAPEPADRTPDEVAATGWAGTLTFPRELTVAGDRVLSAPARELTGLRAARLPTRDGQRAVLDEPAWEVVARGEVRVELLGPSGAREVWRSAGPARDVRVLVDGSLLEAFADGRVATHRVYPGPDEVWQVHGDDVTAWRLAVPGPGPDD